MRLWWVTSCVAVAGCGVLSGLDDLTVTDGGGVDASDDGIVFDVSIDISSSCESGACNAPAGFQPVLFAEDRNTSCPGSVSPVDVVIDPSPAAGACTCACNYQPSCFPEALSYNGGNNTCTQLSTTTTVLDGGCNKGSGQFPPSNMAFGPFAPTNPCTSTLASPGSVTSTAGRLCGVTSCTACTAPSGFSLCYAQSGAVACPSNMKSHVVGAAAAIECGACGVCTSTAKCKGTLTIYDDDACNTNATKFPVDGTCNTAFNVDTLGSYKYAPTVDQGTCLAGTSVASVNVGAPTTVCCP